MSKDIYGVFDVHPEDVMKPNWTDALPDKTGAAVRYFDTITGVQQAVIDCSKGNWTFKTPYGPEQQCLTIGSVGVVYRITASDEVLEYIEAQRQQTANSAYLFTAPLPVDAIQDMLIIIPEDVLHEMRIVELDDAQQHMQQRREHMMQFDALLQASNPKQCIAFDTKLVRFRDAARMLYGSHGMLTHPNMNHEMAYLYTIMKNVFESGRANIEYAMYVPYLYSIFESTFLDGKQSELQLRQMRAARATLEEIAKLADKQGDFKMRSLLYSLQNHVNKELATLEAQ